MERPHVAIGGEGVRAHPEPGIASVLRELVQRMQAAGRIDLREALQEAAARVYGFSTCRVGEAPSRGMADSMAGGGGGWRHPVPGGSGVLLCEGRRLAPEARESGHVQALADLASLVLEIERLRGASGRPRLAREPPVLVGRSAPMAAVRARIAQVGRTPFPVLVLGESGVGKELVARLVHEHSRRARGPFVAVNCAAIVDTLLEAELFGIEDRTATGVRGRRGKFEQADGGTLFLDEIGDLAMPAQAKLLRVLQDLTVERVGGHASVPVDVRVVAATNRDLPQLTAEGRFRGDLYYRLNGVEIEVPPLRDRLDDLPHLVAHVLARHGVLGSVVLTDEALMAMHGYRWPGNVRELERVIERALALCEGGRITVADLPARISGAYGDVMVPALREGVTLRAFAAQYVRLMVERLGSRREAGRVLNISYHTIRSYLSLTESLWPSADDPARDLGPVSRPVALVADRAELPFAPAAASEVPFLDPARGA